MTNTELATWRYPIRAHKKRDGLLLIDATGKARYATWLERLAYWAAGTLPREI